ncbi:MAG: type II secretion system major pseudopilin GspG [Gammaproteobacteria bacterium]|nr:type II secretion system major pseudopilin GspG [Gammaproteobacteria bacterium]
MQLLKTNVKKLPSSGGFTLIELLVVLVILGLLAGMVGPNVMKYIGSSKVEVAKAQLEDLSAGLDLFKLDVGRYPSDDEGLRVLVEGGDGIMGWNGPYLRKKRVPLDPWNRDYVYLVPGQENEYDLYSLGADGEPEGDGEDRDLNAWD